MLAYWVDNIKYRSILSNRTVRVSTLVNYRSIFSNRTVTVKLSRGGHGPPWPPLRVAYGYSGMMFPHVLYYIVNFEIIALDKINNFCCFSSIICYHTAAALPRKRVVNKRL